MTDKKADSATPVDPKLKKQQETDEFSENAANQFSGGMGKFQQFLSLLFYFLQGFGAVSLSIPIVGQAITGFGMLWDVTLSALGINKKEGRWSRGLKTTFGVTAIGLLIASIAAPVAALTIGFVALGLGFIQETWTLSAAIISRARGSWKKERKAFADEENIFYSLLAETDSSIYELLKTNREVIRLEEKIEALNKNIDSLKSQPGFENQVRAQELIKKRIQLEKTLEPAKQPILDAPKDQQHILEVHKKMVKSREKLRSRDADLGSKVHGFTLGLFAATNIIMLATPLAPLAGTILLGIAVYSFLVAFDIPGNWSSKLRNRVFNLNQPETNKEIKKGLETYLKAHPSKKPQPSPALQKGNSYPAEPSIQKKLHIPPTAISSHSSTDVISSTHEEATSKIVTPPDSAVSDDENEQPSDDTIPSIKKKS